MTKIQFRKHELSIQNIGRNRFWIGLAAGLLSAIILSLFFNHSREVLRLVTGITPDLLILPEQEVLFFNYFFSFLSTVLGHSITIWIWMQNKHHKRRKDRLYKLLSVTNAVMMFAVALMLISRIGSNLTIVLFAQMSYDHHLPLYEEYSMLFILVPIVIFLHNWHSVRLAYRAGKCILISSMVVPLIAIGLQFTATVDQKKNNQAYLHRFIEEHTYIEREVKMAKENYGIDFNDMTIEILKKWNAESSVEQIKRVKTAFSSLRPVTLDTILLQKIIIRNYKQTWEHHPSANRINNWPYALPVDIERQLEYFHIRSNETKELYEVLREMVELVNAPETFQTLARPHTYTLVRKRHVNFYEATDTLISQLKETRKRLIENSRDSILSNRIPEIYPVK